MAAKIITCLKNFFLIMLSILICLIIAEFFLRSISVINFRESPARFLEYHPIMGWKNKPEICDTFRMTDSTSFVTINHNGLRNAAISYEKQNKPRIAIMGDSFTWGFGVDNDKRFSDLLQNIYFNNSIEVINCGVIGYGTDQELLFYENEIRKYNPDMVILAFTFTDIDDILKKDGKPYYILDEQGNLKLKNVPVPKPTTGQKPAKRKAKGLFSFKDFKVIELVREGIVAIPLITDYYLANKMARGELNLNLAEKLIMTLKSRVEKDNAHFVVFMIPSNGDTIRGRYNAIFGKLFAFFNDNNIDYILPLDSFIKNKRSQLYFKVDKHFNEHGHLVAAQEIYRYIKDNSIKYPYLMISAER